MAERRIFLRALAVLVFAVLYASICTAPPAGADEPEAQGEKMFRQKRLSNRETFPGEEIVSLLGKDLHGTLQGMDEEAIRQMAEREFGRSCKEDNKPGQAAYPKTYTCMVWTHQVFIDDPSRTGWYQLPQTFPSKEAALAHYRAHPVTPDGKPAMQGSATQHLDLTKVENREAFVALYLRSGKLAYVNPNGQTNALYLSEAYDSTLSLPFTKFVFGNLDIDLVALERIDRTLRDVSAQSERSAADKKNIEELERQVSATTDRAQRRLRDVSRALASFMTVFPFLLLFVVFFLQMLSLVVGKAGGFKEAQGVSPVKLMFRFFAFAVGILFWRPAVMWLIDFFNLMSLAIATYEEQTAIIATISQNLSIALMESGDSGYSGATIGGIILTVCAWVVEGALFLMMIARDIMLGLSCVLGPVSLALGYYKNMTGSGNALGEYITGWCGNFIKLLLWGILTAIMIVSLGLYSAVSTMTGSRVVTLAITACAFVYAAANIPKYAENMSTLAMQSLLMAVPAAAGTYGWNASRASLTLLGGMGINLFKRGVARFISGRADRNAEGPKDDGPKVHY